MRAKAAFLILILLAVLPQVSFAVQPLCKDFEEIPGDASTYQGSSYNSLYYAQDGRWDRWFQAPTNYNPFHSAALGAHCANNWHYDDLDGDGTTEAYLLTGEPFTVWFNAYADSARDVLGRDAHFGSFNVISFDERWNNGPAYPCPDNPDDPKDFSLSYCTSNNVSVAVEKIYTTPQKTLMTPPVFGFLEVSLGAPIWKQWFAYGWASFPLKYKDEKGNERNYLVLNCAADQDCGSSGKCIKPTADPLENFCASPSGSEMILKTDSVYSTDLPADNVIPYDSASEICKQFNSESENTRLVSLSAIGFNKGPSLLNARVYSDNNNVPGELLASASTYAKITGTAHEESVVFENPVSVKGKFWVCLNSRSSNEYGYLSFNYSTPHTFYFESGNLRPAHSSRDYAIRAKVKIYTPPVAEDLDSSPAINPFILKSGDSADSGGESGGQREKNFAVPALVFAGILGAAYLVARPLKINSWIPRITPIFPTEKNSITPRGVNNNAIRRQIAGKYLSGFGNAGAADKIANWLPGGQYFNAKQKYGEEYARTQEAADRKRWDDGMKLLWKDAAVGGSAKSFANQKIESLGDRFVEEFKKMKVGTSKAILFNRETYVLQKSLSGEESFYNMNDELRRQSTLNADRVRLIKFLERLPIHGEHEVDKTIFDLVNLQETLLGIKGGAKKVYRGVFNGMNLEVREYSDGRLTAEKDMFDPIKQPLEHFFNDVLTTMSFQDFIMAVSKEQVAPMLPKINFPQTEKFFDFIIAILREKLKLILENVKAGGHFVIDAIGSFTEIAVDKAEQIFRIVGIWEKEYEKPVNDGRKSWFEGIFDSSKIGLINGVEVSAVTSAALVVVWSGFSAVAIGAAALFTAPIIIVGELLKWTGEKIGQANYVSQFTSTNTNLMADIRNLWSSINYLLFEKTLLEARLKIENFDDKEKTFSKLKEIQSDINDKSEKLATLYAINEKALKEVEVFVKDSELGGRLAKFNAITQEEADRSSDMLKKSLSDRGLEVNDGKMLENINKYTSAWQRKREQELDGIS